MDRDPRAVPALLLVDRVRALARDPRVHAVACDLTACGLLIATFIANVQAVRDLQWPFDPDHWRDIAQAQTVRDGHLLSDQYYRGEWAWYNPLLAWVVALVSLLSGADVALVHVRAGPYLTLLAPVAFYLLARRLVGVSAALASLTVYLFFVCGNEPSWAYATYSPWLFSSSLGQAFFYASVLALLVVAERATPRHALAAGALIGLTFLAHTAPAVILAGIACVVLAREPRVLIAVGGMALLVSSPFLYAIGVHYHLHVVNLDPIIWRFDAFAPDHFADTVRESGLLLLAGVIALAVVSRRRVLVTWLALAVALFVWNAFPGILGFRPFLPSFHFWLYLTCALALLTGATVAWLCPRPLALVVVVLAVSFWDWSIYTQRGEIQAGRSAARTRDPNYALASAYLRQTRRPDEVVLGTSAAAGFIIGPAGRKTIAPRAVFANPYVEVKQRSADRDFMLAAIDRRDLPTLIKLARVYDVSTVVSVGPAPCASAERTLQLEWRAGNVCISTLPRLSEPAPGSAGRQIEAAEVTSRR